MTNQSHLITPPFDLINQWEDDILNSQDNVDYVLDCAWRNGFQAGADQELESILEMIGFGQQSLPEEDRYMDGLTVASIRAARRSKPPSLKEQALAALDQVEADFNTGSFGNTIRRALETL